MKYIRDDNYCSYSPEELFGVRFNYSCFVHDRHYRNEVVIRRDRKAVDQHLRNTIYRAFVVADKKYRGYIISRMYYIAVRLFGRKHWVK